MYIDDKYVPGGTHYTLLGHYW